MKDLLKELGKESTAKLEPADWAKVSSKKVAEKKIRIAKFVKRKLVDNDERNLVGLGELGELVSQDQTEF